MILKNGALALGLSLAAPLLVSSCGKEPGYMFFSPLRDSGEVSYTTPVRSISMGGAADILWVIDNSGSMIEEQAAVVANSALFMQNFLKYNIKWKMGLISTDVGRAPYAGFTPGTLLDSTVADPVVKFQTAVNSLGVSGAGLEKTFDPLLKHLTAYPDFLRKDVPLAVIVVTDAEEQSDLTYADFAPRFKNLIGNRDLYVYGVFNANDMGFGCNGEDGDYWTYAGSPYEQFVQSGLTGQAFPMCVPDFGKQLATIGDQIFQRVQRSALYLNDRPKIPTIRISYKGEVLPGGRKEDGGFWLYDYSLNAIVFHDLAFSTGLTDSVDVYYERDDGFPPNAAFAPPDAEAVTKRPGTAAFGPRSDKDESWIEFPFVLESAHPYGDNLRSLIPVVFEGAQKMSFYFEKIKTESCCDYLQLYNGREASIGKYTAEDTGFWTDEIEGDRSYLYFYSDSTQSEYGYKISKVKVQY